MRDAHRKHTGKVLAVVDDILKNYDGSTGTKDKVKRVIITLEEKLSTLKAFDESILAAIDDDETMDAEIQVTKMRKCSE